MNAYWNYARASGNIGCEGNAAPPPSPPLHPTPPTRQTLPMPLTRALPNLQATEALAAALAERVRAGDAILLEGDLGVGKTAFARAFLRALTADPALDVPSPTFTLVQTYETPKGFVHHYDLWRLAGAGAMTELGWDEALDDIVLVEWPDRLGRLTPPHALTLTLRTTGEDSRAATLDGWADRLEHLP